MVPDVCMAQKRCIWYICMFVVVQKRGIWYLIWYMFVRMAKKSAASGTDLFW